MKRLLCILSSFYLFSACVDKKESCSLTIDRFLTEQGNKVFATSIINKKEIEYRDKGTDSIEGGYYTFYKNGNLKSYQYFSSLHEYIYNEEYDSSGVLIKKEGNPFVGKSVKFINKDSLQFYINFFSFNKNYKKIQVITNSKTYDNLNLSYDSVYSFMKYASFGLNVKGMEHIRAYLNVDYENECTGENSSFKDTIALHHDL